MTKSDLYIELMLIRDIKQFGEEAVMRWINGFEEPEDRLQWKEKHRKAIERIKEIYEE